MNDFASFEAFYRVIYQRVWGSCGAYVVANPMHLGKLSQGVDAWNRWRVENPNVKPNLAGARLYDNDLKGRNYSNINFQDTNLNRADLRFAVLTDSLLENATLQGARLRGAYFWKAQLMAVDFSQANLFEARLIDANLQGANFQDANLTGVSLNCADCTQADYSNAVLMGVQALGTNFTGATLTGACIKDWNINAVTQLTNVLCEYIFLHYDVSGNRKLARRPRSGIFQSGEFVALFQRTLDTIDLIFKDGIDWQAFFQSFQELRSRYSGHEISIQSVERKQGNAFVIRLNVSSDADKTSIEHDAKRFYYVQLKLLEAEYEKQLRLQGAHLKDIREILKIEREERTRLSKVVEQLAEGQKAPKYDMRGAQIAGGVADTVNGSQYGGVINNYGSNTEDITRLLATLRDQAQTFPTDQKDDANDALDDLERDLAEEQSDQGRISRRLKKLVALGAAIGTIASGAAAVSGDVSAFTSNVIELTEKLGIPIEQVQLPASGTP